MLAGFSVSQRRAGRFVKTSSIHPWRLRRVIPDAEALLHGPPAASFSFGVACAAGCRFGYRLRRFLWLRCCLRRWVSLWKSSVPLCRADVKHRIHILKHRVRGARGPEPVGGPPAPGKARAEAPWMALCRSAERSGPLATGTCQGRKPAPDRAANRHLPGLQTGTCQGRKPAPDRAANRHLTGPQTDAHPTTTSTRAILITNLKAQKEIS